MSKIAKDNEKATVTPDGDIVANITQQLKDELLGIIAEGIKTLIINMDHVEMVDSLGIGVLVGAHNSLKKSDGTLELINVSEDITHLFVTMRLNDYLKIQSK